MTVYIGVLVFSLWAVITSASFQGDVPPHIDVPISQAPVIVDIRERLGFTFTCSASGHPAPSYDWTRDGKPLRNPDESITPFPNGTLYFKNFTDNENGIYQCMATNSLGTSLSVKVPLWNENPPRKSTSIATKSEVQTVQAGEPVTLRCENTPDTVPKWNRRWYLTKGTTEVQTNHRIDTDSEGNLRFAYAQKEDSRSYTCGLVPRVLKPLQEITMYKTVELRVLTRSDTVQNKPLQIVHPKESTIKGIIGHSITLECFFSGHPIPTITWTRGNSPITAAASEKFTVTDFGRRLKISKLEEGDEGQYACEGSNGFDTKRHVVFVNVTSAPMKVPYSGLINTVTPDRKSVVLRCVARASHGENLDSPAWFRNGRPLDTGNLPDPARYSFSRDYTELHITQLNKTTDTACFQCNVSNSEGYTFYDAYLHVLESIKITKHPEPVNEISRDQVLDTSVLAVGDSCCTLSHAWFLNGVRLHHSELESPPFSRDNDGRLWFDPRNVSGETLAARTGRYLVNVSSIHDFQEVEFNISMKDDAPVAETLVAAKEGLQLWWVILACGLMIIVVAVAILVVVKRNYPGETYALEKTEIKHHLNPKEDLLNHSFQEI